jgi:myosin-5
MLRRRWLGSKIYPCSGDILISINPYKLIPNLYDNPTNALNFEAQIDHSDEDSTLSCPKEMIAHVYRIAYCALRSLVTREGPEIDAFGNIIVSLSTMAPKHVDQSINQSINQSVIISGESGAGNTALMLMR